MVVYVISKNGQPIMPTQDCRKVRLLLKAGKAKVVRRTPFTIKLTGTAKTYTQSVVLGVDAGSKHVGISASTEKAELFSAELTPRNDVKELMEARRKFRRARRSRTTRHRQPRFDNRVHSKKKGWLAPSVEVKIHNHIQGIRLVTRLLPVTKLVVETAEFDLQALKAEVNGESKPVGVEYQRGEMYGFYNTRQYALWRDGYKCRCCGAATGKFYVVTAEGKSTVSPEDSYVVCERCFKSRSFRFRKRRHWTHPTFMGIMRKTLMVRLKELFPNIIIEETTGAKTKMLREASGLPKSHVNDARCIAGHPTVKPVQENIIKPVRRHNRQIHKATIGKGNYRKLNQTPKYVFGYQLFDKVKLNNEECFIFGRRASGSFDVRHLNGTKVSAGVSYKKLRFLEPRRSLLIERRDATSSPRLKAGVSVA